MKHTLYKRAMSRRGKCVAVFSASGLVLASLAFPAGLSLAEGHHGGDQASAPLSGSLSITSAPWACEPSGAPCPSGAPSGVDLYTLTNSRGMTADISNYGGVLQSLWVPDRTGHSVNVVLGFKYLGDYVNDFQDQPWPLPGGSGDTYFGAIIGRYANRIANASFTLNGVTYHLPANNGPNTLHGGLNAYNTRVWSATTQTTSTFVALKLTYTDPVGYNGFPGAVSNTVTYSLDNNNDLNISYGATTTDPTVINFTNHAYFNLAGESSGDVFGQYLWINAAKYQPVDLNLIPLNAGVPVSGTAMDFTTFHPIGENIARADLPDNAPMQVGTNGQPVTQLQITHGYDFNWVLNGSNCSGPNCTNYRLDAVGFDPGTGIWLRELTDQPGVQLYSSNFLVGDLVGTGGHIYRQGDGFTLETQHFPDSPHHIGEMAWPSVVLNPGEAFSSCTTYQFGTEGPGFVNRSDFANETSPTTSRCPATS